MSLDVTLYLDVDAGGAEPKRCRLFEANYTHNCNRMADEAGIYGYVWRPDENNVETASDLIEPLRSGIEKMKEYPEKFIALNPENGWGSYDTFLPWLERYLDACMEYPKALVHACR